MVKAANWFVSGRLYVVLQVAPNPAAAVPTTAVSAGVESNHLCRVSAQASPGPGPFSFIAQVADAPDQLRH